MQSYTISRISPTLTNTAPLFNIRILLCIMNPPPLIILSNYLDSNLFQTVVLWQVKWRQFKQIDLRITLKKNKADSQR